MKARYTDLDRRHGRYRNADESKQPGYLARRMKAYQRLARMQAKAEQEKAAKVRPLKKASA